MSVVLNSSSLFWSGRFPSFTESAHCTQEVRALEREHESSSATEHLWSTGYDVSLTR